MALPQYFTQPNSGFSSTSVNGVVTDTLPPGAGASGWRISADYVGVPTLTTAPPNAASVFTGYTAQTASVATIVQNTLGYDAQFVAYFQGAASVATFQIGVGATSPPPTITVATSVNTGAATTIGSFDFPAYVPTGYYYSIQVSQANAASVPSAGLTIVAYPV